MYPEITESEITEPETTEFETTDIETIEPETTKSAPIFVEFKDSNNASDKTASDAYNTNLAAIEEWSRQRKGEQNYTLSGNVMISRSNTTAIADENKTQKPKVLDRFSKKLGENFAKSYAYFRSVMFGDSINKNV